MFCLCWSRAFLSSELACASHQGLRNTATDAPQAGDSLASAVQATGIDVASECPAGHGRVTCWSVYGGPDLDFRSPDLRRAATGGGVPACVLYVDTYLSGAQEDLPEVLAIWAAMREFLESADYPKARPRSAL
jgi:hypothetical protein